MTTMPDISSIQKSFKGILLDLDNTLYDYEPCHVYALEKCHTFFSDNVQKVDFETFYNLYLQGRRAVKKNNSATVGSRSRHLYFQLMLEIGYGETDVKNSLRLGDIYWESFIEKMMVRSWVLEFLKSAKTHGIKVVLVTNQESSLQYKKLMHLGLERLIDYMVTSEEAGVEKPDIKIFRMALDKIGMKIDDVIMIGDDPEEDGKGATSAGISFLLCG